MSNRTEDTENERLRAEIRHLRSLLTGEEGTQAPPPSMQGQTAQSAPELANTRKELEQRARLFDTVLSSLVDFVFTFDRAGRFTCVNPALLALWQMRLEDALGKNFYELNYPAELADRLQQQIETVFQTGQTIRDETPYTNAAGATGYYEYIFAPAFGKEDQVEAVAGSTRDITQRYQAQAEKEALLKSLDVERARLAGLFMQAPAFIAVLRGPQHTIEMTNPLYDQLIGRADALGKSVLEAMPEVEAQGFIELLDTVYRTGRPFVGSNARFVFQAENDAAPQEHFVDFVYQPLLEADGAVSGVFVHGVDLTEYRQAQSEIENLNRRLRRSVQETHHRVKNNLQVISALVELQTDGASLVPAAALARIGHHTRALATIHDLLTHEAKSSIEAEYISVRAALDKLVPLCRWTRARPLPFWSPNWSATRSSTGRRK